MSGMSKAFFLIMAVSFLIGSGSSFAINDNGGQIPIVGYPRLQDSLRVDTVWANPDQQYVEVPVYFHAKSGDQITGFEFNIAVPNDFVEYADSNIVDAWYGGTTLIYDGTSYLEVQGFDTTITANQDTTFKLITFYFNVLDTVSFNQQIALDLTDDVYFYLANSPDTAFDPFECDGWITTPVDSIYVEVDTVFGYSYQAFDLTDPVKDTMFVRVPVMFYTAFDVGHYTFDLVIYPLGDTSSYPYQYAGYETKEGNPYKAEAVMADQYVMIIRNISTDSLFIPRETEDTLLTLLYRIKDFSTQYNDEVDFDTTISIYACPSGSRYFQCFNSDEYVILVPDSNFHSGAIELPEYNAYFQVAGGHMDGNGEIACAVRSQSNYYTQFYQHILYFDATKLELLGVTPGAAPVPQGIEYTIIDTVGIYAYVEIVATNVESNEYMPPSITDIYYLDFRATPAFTSGYTLVDAAEEFGPYAMVHDYFSPFPMSGKIVRDNYDVDGFNFGFGVIYRNGPMAPLDPGQSVDQPYGPVDVTGDNHTPYFFSLGQNYPNPFNVQTNIQFSIANQTLFTICWAER
jgi:hypothetical protein